MTPNGFYTHNLPRCKLPLYHEWNTDRLICPKHGEVTARWHDPTDTSVAFNAYPTTEQRLERMRLLLPMQIDRSAARAQAEIRDMAAKALRDILTRSYISPHRFRLVEWKQWQNPWVGFDKPKQWPELQ